MTKSKFYFENFIRNLLKIINSSASTSFTINDNEKTVKMIAEFLKEINRFFYCKSEDLSNLKCKTGYGEEEYFSEFHKFWEENHKVILGLKIDNEKCKKVANVLELYYRPFSPSSVLSVQNLTREHIADIRLFTTIQDFGFGLKVDYYKLAHRKPYLFNAKQLLKEESYIGELLTELGVADYQRDKRMEWIKRCAKMLIEKFNGTAFNIGYYFDFDAVKIRNFLVNANIGISDKKADMFLRDMQEFKVWDLKRFEEISVPSDMNTMRIALRTGIVRTRVPLLSSFMDIFCYQYGAVDNITAEAWRRVWNIWRKLPNNHAVSSPAYIDYLIYNMGRRGGCCRPKIRRCEIRCSERQQKRCILKQLVLTECDGWCIFKDVCEKEDRLLNPPKSISIYGRYGWTTAYSDKGGGLGLRC